MCMAEQVTAKKDAKTQQLKVPPHSFEAEQSVLGGLMLDNEAWDRVAERVIDKDFYSRPHRLIFQAMTRLSNAGNPIDLITLQEELERSEQLEESGGFAYLVEIAKNTPSAANINAYAEIVRERAVVREMISVANEIVEAGYEPQGRTSGDLLDLAESKVFQIAEQRTSANEGPQPLKLILEQTVDKIEELFKTPHNGVTGVSSGYGDLDKMTAGLQPTDLVILAARPAMGKTTFALNIAEYAAIKSKKAVAVFSMEMSAGQLAMRLISSVGRINATRLRTGQLEDEDWSRVNMAIKMLSEVKVFIDDTPALSPDVLRSKARRIKREHDLGLIVVDYLQLMQVPGTGENRTNEISEISRSLKALAKELNVPVVALSQLNRGLESRTDKRPVMSDLRESGAIEQDADIIMFIYRDEYYHKDSGDKGLAEVIIAKQRSGPTGTIKLKFFGEYTRFDNLARDSVGSFE